MSEKVHTNKLSIYLIKSEYTQVNDILKDSSKLTKKNMLNIGDFYYSSSHTTQPSWVKNFFNGTLDEGHKLFNSSSKGILLVKTKNKNFCCYIRIWPSFIKAWCL